MESKIEILHDYMKSLDDRFYVVKDQGDVDLYFTGSDERDFIVAYIHEGYLEEPVIGEAPKDVFKELSQYKYVFLKKYNELFNEGENEMKDEKNIEVTNLDELQKFINEASELSNKVKNNMFKLNVKIEEIKLWRPEYKEKEKSKINILNEYMQGLDDHLFVEKDINNFYLQFKDNNGNKWWLAEYNILNHKKIINEKGNCPVSLYDELMFYYKDFIEKVNELYEVEEK